MEILIDIAELFITYFLLSHTLVGITIIIAALLYVLKCLSQFYQERNQFVERQRREEFEQKAYENMKEHMEVMNVWKHDYKNQIETIQSLLLRKSYSEAIDYIKKISRDMETELPRVNTGNSTLDAVISSKMLLAEGSGIKFQYQVFNVDQLQLKLTDLASVIGNLLDNAIEANQRMEASEKTFIFLQITPCEEMMCIRVRNSCDGIYKVEKGKLQSRKQGERHGLGIARIMKIVSQEGGFCNYYTRRDCFEFVIMMPAR